MNTNMNKIILVGGGGHAKVLINLLKLLGKYNIAGILDPKLERGTTVSGVSVLGNDGLFPDIYQQGVRNACIAIGSLRDNSRRKTLYEKLRETGFSVPPLIHPQTIISRDSQISEGVQIMAGAIIQAGSVIGQNAIINTGTVIDHDCVVGENTHICPGAVISGGVAISDNTFVGAGATIIQGVKIGRNSIVAAGAVVIDDVPDNSKVMGVPAR